MTLLAIDTSTRAMGIALYDGAQVLYECQWHSKDFHTVELAPAIQGAFKQTSVRVKSLKAIGVAIGPGSYTGLRIGLALAKGLAFAERLALIGVPTLDVLAAAQPIEEVPLAAVLHAGRERLAVGWYEATEDGWRASKAFELMTAEELSAQIQKPTRVCGELGKTGRRLLGRKRKNALLASPAWNVRRPAVLAELAWARWKAGEGEPQLGFSPDYLQGSEAVPV